MRKQDTLRSRYCTELKNRVVKSGGIDGIGIKENQNVESGIDILRITVIDRDIIPTSVYIYIFLSPFLSPGILPPPLSISLFVVIIREDI